MKFVFLVAVAMLFCSLVGAQQDEIQLITNDINKMNSRISKVQVRLSELDKEVEDLKGKPKEKQKAAQVRIEETLLEKQKMEKILISLKNDLQILNETRERYKENLEFEEIQRTNNLIRE